MSGWGLGGWFGGGAAKKKDAPKNAILQLRGTLDMLTKREKHLQNQMDEEDAKARKFISTNKAGMFSVYPRHGRALLSSSDAAFMHNLLREESVFVTEFMC